MGGGFRWFSLVGLLGKTSSVKSGSRWNGGRDESEDWELEEVGRGLANYNSAQLARVKGLKRFVIIKCSYCHSRADFAWFRSSQIAQALGYADSEYVVENITIRVPP